jgi:hypothetical protein
VTPFLQKEDFLKALGKLRPAQRPATWQEHIDEKIRQTLERPYLPKPPHTIKLGNGRQLTVPSVEDRIIQGAIHHGLTRQLTENQSQGTHAIAQELSSRLSQAQTCWVLRCDIKDFFPSLNRKSTLAALQPFWAQLDQWTKSAIEAVLSSSPQGLPQGSPLSSLLAELSMSKVDQYLHTVNGLRYVDDFVLLTPTREEAESQSQSLSRLIRPLGLQLNHAKTTITHYPEASFHFLGEQYPPSPEKNILVIAPTGSAGLGLPHYAGEQPTTITITEGGHPRQLTPAGLQLSKEYFLRSLTDKPTLDAILVLACCSPRCPSPWGDRLYEQRNSFLSKRMTKPLHDAAFKLYVGKIKPKQAEANHADASRVLQALLVGNELMRSGSFPDNYLAMSEPYAQAMQGLHNGNYEQYRSFVSALFKQNYPLRQKNPLPDIPAYEESIVEQNVDLLEQENINIL